MSDQNDQLHKRALYAANQVTKALSKSRNYNELRKEATFNYGRVMNQVWEKLEAGETINGIDKKEVYCKVLGVKMRWTQTAIKRFRVNACLEPKPEKAHSVRVVNLDGATHVVFNGFKYPIRSNADGKKKVGFDLTGGDVIYIVVDEPKKNPKMHPAAEALANVVGKDTCN